jgi:hypothetical protein
LEAVLKPRKQMTNYELLSLIISALSAIGTVGAVVIALWITLHQRKRFKINSVRVSATMNLEKSDAQAMCLAEAKAHFLIENLQPFPIEVFSITISMVRSSKANKDGPTGIGIGEHLPKHIIPAQSQYEVDIGILDRKVGFPKDEVGKISCEINTSAGSQTIPFPEKWRPLLLKALSFPATSSELL